jgi:hypothetical protein
MIGEKPEQRIFMSFTKECFVIACFLKKLGPKKVSKNLPLTLALPN